MARLSQPRPLKLVEAAQVLERRKKRRSHGSTFLKKSLRKRRERKRRERRMRKRKLPSMTGVSYAVLSPLLRGKFKPGSRTHPPGPDAAGGHGS